MLHVRAPADVAEADLGHLGHDALDGGARLLSGLADQLLDPYSLTCSFLFKRLALPLAGGAEAVAAFFCRYFNGSPRRR